MIYYTTSYILLARRPRPRPRAAGCDRGGEGVSNTYAYTDSYTVI